eukprot:TRINITY_DN1704_c0_g1_i1.p1 TRINITY_DN1704_c0_g1~~TRINITY_DN1704_c0_g1_i1.p1  ORF type:complete len:773 (-),score=271.49 TRINITY_DN1704_c0_g1_i1:54-2312(-)
MQAPPSKSLEDTWKECEGPFRSLLTDLMQGMDRKLAMTLYTNVFNYVCSASPRNDELYRNLLNLFKQRTAQLVEIASPLPDEILLDFFVKKWVEWQQACKVLDHIMAYLNRTWVKTQRQANASEVYEVSLASDIQWRDTLFLPLKERLTGAMLALIEKERNGDVIQTHLISNCIQCFVRLGLNFDNPKETTLVIYKQKFEADFLHATETYYTIESSVFIEKNGASSYMRLVQMRFEQEQQRVHKYLHSSSMDPLMSTLDSVLIDKHKEILYAKFNDFLTEDKDEDIEITYILLSRIKAVEPLRQQFEAHVKSVGLAELQKEQKEATEKPHVFVNILLAIFRKYNEVIRKDFKGDPTFVAALDKAFRDLVNNNPVTGREGDGSGKAPHILARYCDLILKKGPMHVTDETEMENTLNDVVSLFKYLPDKDVFMMVYHKLLSRRLITDTTGNEDAEASMISKLKGSQGFEYCMKLQRMITDMALSKDINTDFQGWLEDKSMKLAYNFTIFVLATGSWPLVPPPSNFNIPNDMMGAISSFKQYYENKYAGRKLTYLHHVSRAEIDSKAIRGKVFKLSVSTYQMGVLILFNTASTLTRKDLDSTGLNDTILKGAVIALIKTGILTGPEDPKDWNDDATFSINMKLSPKKIRINCNISVSLGDEKSGGGVNVDVNKAEIEQDRQYKLRAAVVRIMKSRKILSHNELIAECTSQVSRWFTPKITTVKKVIEYLIDQDYLKRAADEKGDSGAMRKYEYVA